MQTFAPRGKIYGPILPQFVLETSMSFGAKVMYALLCNYSSENDHCWPSQVTLASRLSCSVNSVKKYLGELVGARLIVIQREQYRSSVYYMLQPAQARPAKQEPAPQTNEQIAPSCPSAKSDSTPSIIAPEQSKSACQPSKIGSLNNLIKQEENKNPPLPPVRAVLPKAPPSPASPSVGGGSFASDFEKAWELYPKKEAKALARSAWLYLNRLGQLPAMTEIEASIRGFMDTEKWQKEEGRFVPQMSNWLKGQRWLDTPSSTTIQETVKRQQAGSVMQAIQDQHEADRATRKVEMDALRPAFTAFATRFFYQEKPWIMPMAFGLWAYLHGKGWAPAPSDVPDDNTLGIVDFLQFFKRQCEEAAWQGSRASNAVLQSVCGKRADSFASKSFPRTDIPLHQPLFFRRSAQEAFGKAV